MALQLSKRTLLHCQHIKVEVEKDGFVESIFMKCLPWLVFLAGFVFVSCADNEPPVRHRVARYPSAPEEPVTQPYNPNQPPPPPETTEENAPPEASLQICRGLSTPSMVNQGSSSGAKETSRLPSQATTSSLAARTSGVRGMERRSFSIHSRTLSHPGKDGFMCANLQGNPDEIRFAPATCG